jgi:hypothetical protein
MTHCYLGSIVPDLGANLRMEVFDAFVSSILIPCAFPLDIPIHNADSLIENSLQGWERLLLRRSGWGGIRTPVTLR